MFGRVIVAHRQRLGMTQEALAKKTGLAVRSLRELESGRVRTPRTTSILLLADAFGLQDAERERSASFADRRLPFARAAPASEPARPSIWRSIWLAIRPAAQEAGAAQLSDLGATACSDCADRLRVVIARVPV